jgi:hypothetical protein
LVWLGPVGIREWNDPSVTKAGHDRQRLGRKVHDSGELWAA